MLKKAPKLLFFHRSSFQHFFRRFFLTFQGSSHSLSFQENFELQIDHQIYHEESSAKKFKIAGKDMASLLSLAEEDIAAQRIKKEASDAERVKHLLECLSSGYESLDASTAQLHRIAMNLKTISEKTIEQSELYDNNIIRSLYQLARNKILSGRDVLGTMQILVKNPRILSRLDFEGLTNILLTLKDVTKLPSSQNLEAFSKNVFQEIMPLLQKQTQNLIERSHPLESDFSFYLPKILFCFVQFGSKNKPFLNKILSSILYCDISRFEEMEITSLLYTIIKMEKKMHILTTEATEFLYGGGFEELYLQLQEIIIERVKSESLSYKRIPYILYCFAMVGKCSPIAIKGLMGMFLKNIEKFTISEICTIMYCMWRMPEIDPENRYILDILTFYFGEHQENTKLLFNTNLYSALLGIRRPAKSELPPKQKQIVDQFLNRLLHAFEEKFDMFTDESRIRILYEVTHTHKLIDRINFSRKYTPYLQALDLNSLNNHDIITVGYLMKKYMLVDEAHFEFWNKYLDCLSKRKWNSVLEDNRIEMIFSNIKTYLSKYHPQGAKREDLKYKWIKAVDEYYKAFLAQKRTRNPPLQAQKLK